MIMSDTIKPGLVYTAGTAKVQDGKIRFVMSTNEVNRTGDIIENSFRLENFRANPIALYNHDHSFEIGTWANLELVGNQWEGDFVPAPLGISERIDEKIKLVQANILKTVSIGILPGKVEPIDPKKPWAGMRLTDNELVECSVVSVPRNASAVRAMGVETDAMYCSAYEQLKKSRDSGNVKSLIKSTSGDKRMSLSEKIVALSEERLGYQDKLTEMSHEIEETGITEEIELAQAEITAQINRLDREIETCNGVLDGLKPRKLPSAGYTVESEKAAMVSTKPNRPRDHNLIAAYVCALKGVAANADPMAIAQAFYKDDPAVQHIVRNSLPMYNAAATVPADSTTATWAAELVRESWEGFIDIIRDQAVLPRVPGVRYGFAQGEGAINIPRNDSVGMLAPDWTAELAPIPVKAGATGQVQLLPKRKKLISTFSKELLTRSLPNIEKVVRNTMSEDAVESLDQAFTDATARSALRPAGMQDTTEVGAGNVNAATAGAVPSSIMTDTRGMINRATVARALSNPVWVMHPTVRVGLGDAYDAASGTYPFASAVNSGTFRGYPILTSIAVPNDVVFLISGNALAFGNEQGIILERNDSATLVMDTTPTEIVTGGLATTQNTVSMFQSDLVGIKLTLGLDWVVQRVGGVQTLTGVQWGA